MDVYSLGNLADGRHEWANVPVVIRNAFRFFSQRSHDQQEAIDALQRELEQTTKGALANQHGRVYADVASLKKKVAALDLTGRNLARKVDSKEDRKEADSKIRKVKLWCENTTKSKADWATVQGEISKRVTSELFQKEIAKRITATELNLLLDSKVGTLNNMDDGRSQTDMDTSLMSDQEYVGMFRCGGCNRNTTELSHVRTQVNELALLNSHVQTLNTESSSHREGIDQCLRRASELEAWYHKQAEQLDGTVSAVDLSTFASKMDVSKQIEDEFARLRADMQASLEEGPRKAVAAAERMAVAAAERMAVAAAERMAVAAAERMDAERVALDAKHTAHGDDIKKLAADLREVKSASDQAIASVRASTSSLEESQADLSDGLTSALSELKTHVLDLDLSLHRKANESDMHTLSHAVEEVAATLEDKSNISELAKLRNDMAALSDEVAAERRAHLDTLRTHDEPDTEVQDMLKDLQERVLAAETLLRQLSPLEARVVEAISTSQQQMRASEQQSRDNVVAVTSVLRSQVADLISRGELVNNLRVDVATLKASSITMAELAEARDKSIELSARVAELARQLESTTRAFVSADTFASENAAMQEKISKLATLADVDNKLERCVPQQELVAQVRSEVIESLDTSQWAACVDVAARAESTASEAKELANGVQRKLEESAEDLARRMEGHDAALDQLATSVQNMAHDLPAAELCSDVQKHGEMLLALSKAVDVTLPMQMTTLEQECIGCVDAARADLERRLDDPAMEQEHAELSRRIALNSSKIDAMEASQLQIASKSASNEAGNLVREKEVTEVNRREAQLREDVDMVKASVTELQRQTAGTSEQDRIASQHRSMLQRHCDVVQQRCDALQERCEAAHARAADADGRAEGALSAIERLEQDLRVIRGQEGTWTENQSVITSRLEGVEGSMEEQMSLLEDSVAQLRGRLELKADLLELHSLRRDNVALGDSLASVEGECKTYMTDTLSDIRGELRSLEARMVDDKHDVMFESVRSKADQGEVDALRNAVASIEARIVSKAGRSDMEALLERKSNVSDVTDVRAQMERVTSKMTYLADTIKEKMDHREFKTKFDILSAAIDKVTRQEIMLAIRHESPQEAAPPSWTSAAPIDSPAGHGASESKAVMEYRTGLGYTPPRHSRTLTSPDQGGSPGEQSSNQFEWNSLPSRRTRRDMDREQQQISTRGDHNPDAALNNTSDPSRQLTQLVRGRVEARLAARSMESSHANMSPVSAAASSVTSFELSATPLEFSDSLKSYGAHSSPGKDPFDITPLRDEDDLEARTHRVRDTHSERDSHRARDPVPRH